MPITDTTAVEAKPNPPYSRHKPHSTGRHREAGGEGSNGCGARRSSASVCRWHLWTPRRPASGPTHIHNLVRCSPPLPPLPALAHPRHLATGNEFPLSDGSPCERGVTDNLHHLGPALRGNRKVKTTGVPHPSPVPGARDRLRPPIRGPVGCILGDVASGSGGWGRGEPAGERVTGCRRN